MGYLWIASCPSTEEEGKLGWRKARGSDAHDAVKEEEAELITHTHARPEVYSAVSAVQPLTAETTTVARTMIAGRPVLRY